MLELLNLMIAWVQDSRIPSVNKDRLKYILFTYQHYTLRTDGLMRAFVTRNEKPPRK